jgi:DNA-binding transcriptional LysR family regulator
MHDWDDIRIFMAAARCGSLASAAARLGIDAATVGRRVARLESALKSTLMVRSVAGLQLTAAGSRLMEIGLQAETAMSAATRLSEPDIVGGTVRISVAEGFGTEILAPALPALHRAKPALRIELAANSGFLSASTREVDMVVTLSTPTSPRLKVEPLTDYELGLYASTDYLARIATPIHRDDIAGLDLVGYVDDLIYAPELRYLDELGPGLRPKLSSSSIRAQREMIVAGGGAGILPCFLAKGLTRLLPDDVKLTRRFWIGAHQEVTDTARIRALRLWLRDLVREKSALLNPSRRRKGGRRNPSAAGLA